MGIYYSVSEFNESATKPHRHYGTGLGVTFNVHFTCTMNSLIVSVSHFTHFCCSFSFCLAYASWANLGSFTNLSSVGLVGSTPVFFAALARSAFFRRPNLNPVGRSSPILICNSSFVFRL